MLVKYFESKAATFLPAHSKLTSSENISIYMLAVLSFAEVQVHVRAYSSSRWVEVAIGKKCCLRNIKGVATANPA